MLSGQLFELFYEAASIQRWNDYLRPAQGFTELDKQAHKMMYAYVLGKFEQMNGGLEFDWVKLIEGGLFEFLHRIRLTDIKPPVFHKIMKDKGTEINQWVLEEYHDSLSHVEKGIFSRFGKYLFEAEYSESEKQILKASHYLATNWEFQHIYRLNAGLYGLEDEKENIEARLNEHATLIGVKNLALDKNIRNFMGLVGQLRFQQRWGHSPRIPQTSVLGHMLIVAILVFFASLKLKACPKRIYNNYFCGLFHDLPEISTRDIVAPVKRSVPDLDQIIKDIETSWFNKKLYPLLPKQWHPEIKYFVEDEFSDRIIYNGQKIKTKITAQYNFDHYSPLDGTLIRACDHLAAYSEAYLSIKHGVRSKHLLDGLSIYDVYQGTNSVVSDVDFGPIFRYFDPNELII